jgi:hypothetical protein
MPAAYAATAAAIPIIMSSPILVVILTARFIHVLVIC